MDKFRVWWYKKRTRSFTFGDPLIDHREEVVNDAIHEKIYEIELKMKELRQDLENMKKESDINKKKIRKLQKILQENNINFKDYF